MRTGTTATTDVAAAVYTANSGRPDAPISLLLYNDSASTAYVGASGVTTTTGFPIAASGSLSVPISFGETVYVIMATGLTGTIRYIVQGE